MELDFGIIVACMPAMALSLRWNRGDKSADTQEGKTTTIGGGDRGNGTALGSI